MHINCSFEFSMVLDSEKFQKIFSQSFCSEDDLGDNEDENLDRSMMDDGITVLYRDSQRKKVKLFVEPELKSDSADVGKFIHKTEKNIAEYFDYKYHIHDFTLSGMTLAMSFDVGSRSAVSDYLKVLRRIGRVKGFSPASCDYLDDDEIFCLRGNSNGIQFMIYDWEKAVSNRIRDETERREQLKATLQSAKAVLRAEVWLMKPKAIHNYTDAEGTFNQITELSKNCESIFMDTFARIVPFGEYHKMSKAVEIVRSEVTDTIMRRRMLRLLTLIPEKKSIHLAQKEMTYRHPNDLLVEFAKLNLSPVTISKRHDVKRLKNLYEFI